MTRRSRPRSPAPAPAAARVHVRLAAVRSALFGVAAVAVVTAGPAVLHDPAAAQRAVDASQQADQPRPSRGVWPLDPRPAVAHGFDSPTSRYGRGHRGVDLVGRPGQVVRTALAGRVSFAGRIAGRGVVAVDHGGTRTTYEPVRASVHVGDQLRTGAPVGRLQLAGSHCLPAWCLHWGLIEGRDRYLDPLALLGALPVVLLPLAGALADVRVGPAPARPWVRLPLVARGGCAPPWACQAPGPLLWP